MIRRHSYFVSLVTLAIILSAAAPLAVSSAAQGNVSPTQHIRERAQTLKASAINLNQPRLVMAELFTHTNGDNKDHDTGIYVTVTTSDTKSLLARIISADSSGTDATEYNDNSDHFVELVIQNPAATPSDCSRFQVTIEIRTNGNDTWLFDAQVVLYFSDGSTLFAEQKGISLVNNGAQVVFNAP